jgi:hypothetical protein
MKVPNLMTTLNSRTLGAYSLWSGRFHFLVNAECNIDYLQGSMGGYVSAICLAGSQEEFIARAFEALRNRQLSPDEEFDEIEDLSVQYHNETLSDEWMALCKLASESGDVSFNCFQLYASAEEN